MTEEHMTEEEFLDRVSTISACKDALADALEEDLDQIIALTVKFMKISEETEYVHVVMGAALQVLLNGCVMAGKDQDGANVYAGALSMLLTGTMEANVVHKIGLNQ